MWARIRVLVQLPFGLVTAMSLCGCSASSQKISLPEQFTLPVFEAEKADDRADNFHVLVSATDVAGKSPGDSGFAGASRAGDCRIYINNLEPVSSDELWDRGFDHLDKVVTSFGGVDEIVKTPEKVPSVHLWGDSDAPWRCVAAAIYNVTSSGYPRIGLISGDVEGVSSASVPKVARAVYFEPPFYDRAPEEAFHKVEVTPQNGILWDGREVTLAELNANLLNLQTSGTEKTEIELKPDASASYVFSAQIIRTIQSAGTADLRIVGAKEHCSADSQYVKDSGRCARGQDGS